MVFFVLNYSNITEGSQLTLWFHKMIKKFGLGKQAKHSLKHAVFQESVEVKET